jgi:CheY-like chemotaxis protein
MDGFDCAKSIREYHEKNKIQQPMIIACTGHTESEYMNKAWRHEMDEIVAKPV